MYQLGHGVSVLSACRLDLLHMFRTSARVFSYRWTMTHKNTPERRNRQVTIDTTVDFLCVAIPLCVMWFGYQVPISIQEMMAITLMPTFFYAG